MKFFEDIVNDKPIPVVQQPRVDFQKKGLLNSVGDFSIRVLDAIERWLFSFPSGMTKDAFKRQIEKLDRDEEIALGQLKDAKGFRIIKKYIADWDYPTADKSFAEFIANNQMFITIRSKNKKLCEKYVLSAIKDLKPFGAVYILDCAVLFANLVNSANRGSSDELVSQARKCDFLIIENLDQDIGRVSKASTWAINTIVNERFELGKPILARHNDWIEKVTELYKKCIIYQIKE